MVAKFCHLVVDRLSVHTKGSSGVSGRTAIVGRTFPKDVAEVCVNSELELVNGPVIDLELTCRGFKFWGEDEEIDAVVSDVNEERVSEMKLRVVVDEGITFGIEVGTLTGQNDQTFLPWLSNKLAT
jgi:hypothetical protein